MTEHTISPEQRAAMAPLLGQIPSGVFVLVAGNGEGKVTGMLASWVQQASFDPPQVTVAVNKSRYLNQWLVAGTAVTLNQVAKGDSSLFRHFGKGFEPDAEAFADIGHKTGRNGLPLLTASMASWEGRIVDQLEAGDHILYLVTVNHVHVHRDSSAYEPFVHLRKNGFNY